MLNSKAFKKLAALTAAVALVGSFAVSASAATVNTTTTYVGGSNEAKVTVKVDVEATPDAEVTYYASKGGKVIHVDQVKATNAGAASFEQYVTDSANLEAAVIVNDGAVTSDTIDGRTITYEGNVVKTIANTATSTVVAVTKTLAADEKIKAIEATNAKAAYVADGNTYNVTLTEIEGDVVITITTETIPEEVDLSNGEFIASGVVELATGGYRITVLGKVSGLKEGAAFGAEIDAVKFASKVANPANGYFAIQVEGSELTKTSYTTGVYYTKADDTVLVDYADAQ